MNSENAKKRAANLTTFMLSQDYNPKHWDWSDNEKKALGSCAKVGEIILNRLLSAGVIVLESYIISHDKDEKALWDKYQKDYSLSFVAPHIHFVAKLDKEGTATLDQLADIIGVHPQYIEKPKSGRYAYRNMLAYLIHIKYPSKWQYDVSEVVTLCGPDYQDQWANNHDSWEKARRSRIQKNAQITLKQLEMQISEGEVTQDDLLFNPEYNYVYHLHFSRLNSLLANHQIIEYKRANKKQ